MPRRVRKLAPEGQSPPQGLKKKKKATVKIRRNPLYDPYVSGFGSFGLALCPYIGGKIVITMAILV